MSAPFTDSCVGGPPVAQPSQDFTVFHVFPISEAASVSLLACHILFSVFSILLTFSISYTLSSLHSALFPQLFFEPHFSVSSTL